MNYFLLISSAFIISINSCNQSKQTNSTSTNPDDYTSAKKADTTTSSQAINPDTALDKQQTIVQANSSVSTTSQKYFNLLSSTSESWVAGIPQGGTGTEYYFKIKITTDSKITFDTAWINKQAFGIFITKDQQGISSEPIKYFKGDIITLRVSHLSIANVPVSNLPFSYKGVALIRFSVDGKQNYFVIDEIIKGKTVNRQ